MMVDMIPSQHNTLRADWAVTEDLALAVVVAKASVVQRLEVVEVAASAARAERA